MKAFKIIGGIAIGVLILGTVLVFNAATVIDFLSDLGTLKTYQNKIFGFEFQYPSGWMANDSLIPHEEGENGVRWMSAEEGEFLVYVVRARNGFEGIDVESSPALKKQFSTLDALETELKRREGTNVERTNVAGEEALKQISGGHERASYYFYHNDTLFVIGYYCPDCGNPNKKLQQTVLASFRFTK